MSLDYHGITFRKNTEYIFILSANYLTEEQLTVSCRSLTMIWIMILAYHHEIKEKQQISSDTGQ